MNLDDIAAAIGQLERTIQEALKQPDSVFELTLHWSNEEGKFVIDKWYAAILPRDGLTADEMMGTGKYDPER